MPTPVESRKSWPKRYGSWVEHPNDEQQSVLDRLAELSDERAALVSRKAYTTTSGRHRLDEVYAQLRDTIAQGVALGIGHEQMRDWVRVTRSAYYKIKGGRTGPGA